MLPTIGSDMVPVPRVIFRTVAEEAGRYAEELNAREIANCAWAFATIQVQMPSWLLSEMPKRATSFRSQECANCLWALATSSLSVEDLLPALSLEGTPLCAQNFASWKAQELANAAWALAHSCTRETSTTLHHGSHGLTMLAHSLKCVREAVVVRIEELNALELAMLASTSSPGDLQLEVRTLAKISNHAVSLLHEDKLPPHAMVQLVDSLRLSQVEIPEPIAKAYKEQCGLVLAAVRMIEGSEGASLAMRLGKLQTLGLATLGAAGTKKMLQELGFEGGEHAHAPMALGAREAHCRLEHHLLISAERRDGLREHRSIAEHGRLLVSGDIPEPDGVDALVPVTLRFPRGRDAEFLALTAIVAAVRRTAAEVGATQWSVRGTAWLHISHPPCLSCVGAMLQFRCAYPDVKLIVSF
eukprot:gnl/TRDRNA2_/TRDRNA2_148962_c0_seq1.p1 gnl/TRDRNA2_/TRDRNA2_148962_c0~~gnl/TRDRNA2_/TRDRNA2_148962_c0_seq1.p1  ORF type:complete len:414 (+),score=62.22 gnl/TRDRNA2_/TRDRNA2_148962_c0_seq1:1-1242(+)